MCLTDSVEFKNEHVSGCGGSKLGLFLFLKFFSCFLGPPLQHMDVPKPRGQIATTAAGLRQIRAASATYTTAHGNPGSLTHRTRPGFQPVYSWMLVRFVSDEPQGEL